MVNILWFRALSSAELKPKLYKPLYITECLLRHRERNFHKKKQELYFLFQTLVSDLSEAIHGVGSTLYQVTYALHAKAMTNWIGRKKTEHLRQRSLFLYEVFLSVLRNWAFLFSDPKLGIKEYHFCGLNFAKASHAQRFQKVQIFNIYLHC